MVEELYHITCITKRRGLFIPVLLNCCEVGRERGEKLTWVPDPALTLNSQMTSSTVPSPSRASELYLVYPRAFTVVYFYLLGLILSLAPPQIAKTPV